MFEDNDPLDRNYGESIMLTPQDSANLRKAGKWARFMAIFGMVIMGLAILLMVMFGGTFLFAAGPMDGMGAMLIPIIIIYAAIFGFAFYLIYLQYSFGAKAMQAVDSNDGIAMGESLASLARYYKITGILLLVYLVFMGIGVVASLIGGAVAFM